VDMLVCLLELRVQGFLERRHQVTSRSQVDEGAVTFPAYLILLKVAGDCLYK
jgi:hypothetical protein